MEVGLRLRLGFGFWLSLKVVLTMVLKVKHRAWFRGMDLSHGSGLVVGSEVGLGLG